MVKNGNYAEDVFKIYEIDPFKSCPNVKWQIQNVGSKHTITLSLIMGHNIFDLFGHGNGGCRCMSFGIMRLQIQDFSEGAPTPPSHDASLSPGQFSRTHLILQ